MNGVIKHDNIATRDASLYNFANFGNGWTANRYLTIDAGVINGTGVLSGCDQVQLIFGQDKIILQVHKNSQWTVIWQK